MPGRIAINGAELDKVRMPLEPYTNGVLSYLLYPKSEIRFSQKDDVICLILPAYLSVELYRIGILPQDVKSPVEISVDGRTVGRYVLSDVRYSDRSGRPFGQVTFTMTCVSQGTGRTTGRQRRSRTAAADQGTFVTDITHYLDENGELAPMPGPARKLASFLSLLIDAATATPKAGERDSGIRCRTKACIGTIRTFLTPGQDEISWHCPLCGHNGVVRNWQDTKWNQQRSLEVQESSGRSHRVGQRGGVRKARPDPSHGTQRRLTFSAVDPTIRAVEWAGDEWSEWIRWMATYTMPMSVQPGEAMATGLASERA